MADFMWTKKKGKSAMRNSFSDITASEQLNINSYTKTSELVTCKHILSFFFFFFAFWPVMVLYNMTR